MRRNEEICTVEETKGKGKLRSVLSVLTVVVIIGAAIAKLVKLLKERAKKEEEQNETREIKEYCSYCDDKKIKTPEGEFKGMLVKGVMSSVKIDLTNSVITEGAFISLKANMSAVQIIVPENVNVIVDGKNNMSSINNKAVCECGSAANLYVVGDFVMSAVVIEYKGIEEQDGGQPDEQPEAAEGQGAGTEEKHDN